MKDWDTRVVFNDRSQWWWWNAWQESTTTELYGFADSREDAWLAMQEAISAAVHQEPVVLGVWQSHLPRTGNNRPSVK